jgi:hypothetical protein
MMFDRASIYFDDDENGVFDEGLDPLLFTESPIVLDSGVAAVLDLPSGPPNPQIHGADRQYFVVLDVATDPPATQVELWAVAQPVYYPLGSALTLEHHPPWASSGMVSLSGETAEIFADGFESGTLDQWSGHAP